MSVIACLGGCVCVYVCVSMCVWVGATRACVGVCVCDRLLE